MSEVKIEKQRNWTVNTTGILVLELGTLTIITLFLWIWKEMEIF